MNLTRQTVAAQVAISLLMIVIIPFVVGALVQDAQVGAWALLLVTGLPLIWLWCLPTQARIGDPLAQRFVVMALGLMAWMAVVQVCSPSAHPIGWWHYAERCSALIACLSLATCGIAAGTLVVWLGAVAAATTVVCVTLNAYLGFLTYGDITCFGLGHANIFTNTVGPSMMAWLVLMLVSWRDGVRPRLTDALLVGSGLCALGVQAFATGRRGVVLAYLAVLAWFVMVWMWRSHRRVAMALIGLAAIGVLAVSWRIIDRGIPPMRYERIKMYRAGLEGVAAGLPWGFGHYGYFRILEGEGEASRHYTATGSFASHAHNEFLDATVDGGPVALLFTIGLFGLAVLRLNRVTDARLRVAGQAMAVAITVHLVTDNVYGTETGEAWLGLAMGTFFAMPVAAGAEVPWRLPPVRWMLWPLAAVSGWGIATLLPSLAMTGSGNPAQHAAALLRSRNPELVNGHLHAALSAGEGGLDPRQRTAVIQLAVNRMGWTAFAASSEAQLALETGDHPRSVQAILRLLRFTPFHLDAYVGLSRVLALSPASRQEVPARVQQRLAYLSAVPGLPQPDFAVVPHDIDTAADLYAVIRWAIATGIPWPEISPPLQRLVEGYGDIPGVALLAIEAASVAPRNTFPWLPARAPTMQVAGGYVSLVLPVLQGITHPEQAAAVMPLVRALYPGIVADCERRTISAHFAREDSLILYATVVQLWGLNRVWQAQQKPAPPVGSKQSQ